MPFLIRFRHDRTSADLQALSRFACGAAGEAKPDRGEILAPSSRFVGRYHDEKHDVAVVLSGNLTNAPAPAHPASGADAAQILARLYVDHGVSALEVIDGAFCAAIVDARRNTIVLARDKLGIARAYVRRTPHETLFSDSMSTMLDATGEGADVDTDSIYAFLMIGWIPTPHSMVRGIEKLPAGVFLESTSKGLRQTTYYDVPHAAGQTIHRSKDALKREVAAHLDRSVARGLGLGRRWGSFLSGGVDSSSVVSAIARQGVGGFPTYFAGFAPQLNAFLPNPEEPEMSELVAKKYGTDHRALWLEPDCVAAAAEIVAALEEPVCDGGCIIVDAVMRDAAAHTDVLMTGIAGDFLFTGERRHMVLGLRNYLRLLPTPVWRALAWVLSLPPFNRSTRISQMQFDLTRLLDVIDLSLPEMYAGFYLQADRDELDALFLPHVARTISRDPKAEMVELFQVAANLDPLNRFLYLDLKTQSSEHCVREAEMLGRRHGLIAYHPFLDAAFVDFAMTIPAAQKSDGLNLKLPLKQAMRVRVPDEVLDRKKGGLGSPIRWWVIQEDGFVADTLSDENVERRGLFSVSAVRSMREATASGVRDYSKLLWSLFTLELWLQHFIDKRVSASSPS